MSRKTILSVGLPAEIALAGMKAKIAAEPNSDMAKQFPTEESIVAITKAAENIGPELNAAGYAAECLYISPKDGVSSLAAKLKEKHWDGIMIGFGTMRNPKLDTSSVTNVHVGVRGNPGLAVFFEQLVNTVVENSLSPPPKLMFNISPQSSIEAAKRQLPVSVFFIGLVIIFNCLQV